MIEPKQECKISRDISRRILCLPTFAELTQDELSLIIDTIRDTL